MLLGYWYARMTLIWTFRNGCSTHVTLIWSLDSSTLLAPEAVVAPAYADCLTVASSFTICGREITKAELDMRVIERKFWGRWVIDLTTNTCSNESRKSCLAVSPTPTGKYRKVGFVGSNWISGTACVVCICSINLMVVSALSSKACRAKFEKEKSQAPHHRLYRQNHSLRKHPSPTPRDWGPAQSDDECWIRFAIP